MKALLGLLFFLLITQVSWCQNIYTTKQGTSYSIQNDFSYKRLSDKKQSEKAVKANTEEVALTYILQDQELDAIIYLEKSTDEREVQAYTDLLRTLVELNKSTSPEERITKENQIDRIEQRMAWTKKIGQEVGSLRRLNKKERQQAYARLHQLMMRLNRLSPYQEGLQKASIYPELSSDESKPYLNNWENNCEIVFDGFDEDLKSKRKETQAQQLFGHTHPRLRRHFKDGDYLSTKAALAKIDGDYYLMLTIDIASKSATKNYGAISPKERTRFRFVDGKSMYLRPLYLQKGSLQEYTGHTIYKPIYRLSKDDFKLLEKVELDDVGLMWTSGFESYEVYHIDVLQNLAKCLKK